MSYTLLITVSAFSVFVGLLIGATSIGGVLLVPILVYISGIDIRLAIAAAMFGYLFTGFIGSAMFARHGSIEWRAVLWLCLGAMPFAFAGAVASNIFPTGLLELAIAGLILFAGWQSLRSDKETQGIPPQGSMLAGIGCGVGFVSAVTGTGGPVTLAPILLWLEIPVLTTIGLSQAIMMPIAAAATAGNVLNGTWDLMLGAAVAVGLSAGAFLGARFAHRMPVTRLKRFLAGTLVVIGVLIIAKLTLGLFGIETI